jgi:hypothetical protein
VTTPDRPLSRATRTSTPTASRAGLPVLPNAEGVDACPFSRTRSEEGLPVLTVDEEIYRFTSALVIATVDKLAQLPSPGSRNSACRTSRHRKRYGGCSAC